MKNLNLKLIFLQMQTPEQILQKYWGYPAFRGLQQNIIASVLQGKDVLAVLPTGGVSRFVFRYPL